MVKTKSLWDVRQRKPTSVRNVGGKNKKIYLLKNTHNFRGSIFTPTAWYFTFDRVLLHIKNAYAKLILANEGWKVERTVNRKAASIVFIGVVILHATKFLFSFLSKSAGIFFTSTPGFNGMNCNYIDITGILPTSPWRTRAFSVKGLFAYFATHIPTYGSPASEAMKKCILL